MRSFLDFLTCERKVRPSTRRVYLGAINFFYHVTLERPTAVVKIPYPRVTQPLPDILSPGEIEQMLTATRSLKHRAILMSAYGAGLRVTDIDSERMLIHVHDGKGGLRLKRKPSTFKLRLQLSQSLRLLQQLRDARGWRLLALLQHRYLVDQDPDRDRQVAALDRTLLDQPEQTLGADLSRSEEPFCKLSMALAPCEVDLRLGERRG